MCDLADDVEPSAQQPEIVLMPDVAAGQAAPHGGEQPVREQPDEELQEIAPLRVQGRELSVGHPQVAGHGEHVEERPADGAVLSVAAVLYIDLGQDLEGLPRNGEDADDLRRFQDAVGTAVGAGQNGWLPVESPAGTLGEDV